MIRFTLSNTVLMQRCPNLYNSLINPLREQFNEGFVEDEVVFYSTWNYPQLPPLDHIELVCYSFIARYRGQDIEVIVTREDKEALMLMYQQELTNNLGNMPNEDDLNNLEDLLNNRMPNQLENFRNNPQLNQQIQRFLDQFIQGQMPRRRNQARQMGLVRPNQPTTQTEPTPPAAPTNPNKKFWE